VVRNGKYVDVSLSPQDVSLSPQDVSLSPQDVQKSVCSLLFMQVVSSWRGRLQAWRQKHSSLAAASGRWIMVR